MSQGGGGEVTAEKLARYLASVRPTAQHLQVDSLVDINDGWESDVYAYTLSFDRDGVRAYSEEILRIYPGANAATVCVRESTGLRLLREAGYPVPQVLHLEEDATMLGRPFLLMEKIQGEVLWHLINRATPTQMQEYLLLFCQLFVNLHQLEWDSQRTQWLSSQVFQYERMESTADAIGFQLNRVQRFYERTPEPDLLPLFEWLNTRKGDIPPVQLSPIHWDFHPGNILLRSDGRAFVIDWTQVEVSDPRFDLAWTLILTGSQAGWDSSQYILREYNRIAGSQFESLEYFEVFACAKRLFAVLVSVTHGADKLGMRPGAEKLMRQSVGPLSEVYARLIQLTGIQVDAIERMLDEFQSGNGV